MKTFLKTLLLLSYAYFAACPYLCAARPLMREDAGHASCSERESKACCGEDCLSASSALDPAAFHSHEFRQAFSAGVPVAASKAVAVAEFSGRFVDLPLSTAPPGLYSLYPPRAPPAA